MLSSNTSAVSGDTVYVEDVFSTYLYTGNSAARSISNGVDLSTKGGMVWIKSRPSTTDPHVLTDTARGATKYLSSNATTAETTNAQTLTAFNTDGFSLGTDGRVNQGSTTNYVAWTFRKQPKFFDVVTYTGTGVAHAISHNLGSAPGFIMVKKTSAADDWFCYHRSLTANNVIYMDLTNATNAAANMWNNTAPTSTEFTVGTDTGVNANGATFVAYLFAHDAGGFGLAGTDNVISCGSYTGTGATQEITLGYEPQWIMVKKTNAVGNWVMGDVMRGIPVASADGASFYANTSGAEQITAFMNPTATGFNIRSANADVNTSGGTYIYIAIRRGPMKVPTDATKVFSPNAYTGAGAGTTVSVGFPPDMQIVTNRDATANGSKVLYDRLRAGGRSDLLTNATDAEVYGPTYNQDFNRLQTQIYSIGSNGYTSSSGKPYISYAFQRAPSFFDEVCYTGNGANQTLPHNLGAVPQLMITKNRTNPSNWRVYDAFNGATKRGSLNDAQPWDVQASQWNDTAPTATQFTVGTSNSASGSNYVIYLFASCPGVSKVGSYTGTGTTLQINCGFTAGARFVLIKRTDSTGDWYVWDSARGIVAGNDPYLLLNSTAAEVTSTDYIDTYSAGFELSSTAPAALNASGGTYIFLAIA